MKHIHKYRLADLLRDDGTLPPVGGGDGEGEQLDPPADDPPVPRTVPLSEHTKERNRARAAERKTEELEARLKEIDAKDQSEVERLTKRVGELEETNSSLASASEKERKSRWIESAASEFHSPAAAAAMLDPETFDAIDSKESAAEAVAQLAQRDAWLVRPKGPEPTGVQKILDSGARVEPGDGGKKMPTLEEVKAMSQSEINARWDDIQPVLAAQKQ